MAHFAKLDSNNEVLEVLVVMNDDIKDENGNEVEQIGIDFLDAITDSSSWVQTSYNNTFRKNYAGIGYTYDSTRDAFIEPQPFPSWILNEETCIWECSVPYPEDETYIDEDGKEKTYTPMCIWDEAALEWGCDGPPPLVRSLQEPT